MVSLLTVGWFGTLLVTLIVFTVALLVFTALRWLWRKVVEAELQGEADALRLDREARRVFNAQQSAIAQQRAAMKARRVAER